MTIRKGGGSLIKSNKSGDHIKDVKEVFKIFRRFKMKLNPLKCAFGVSSGKFLVHIVSKRGIEPSPTQMKTLLEIEKLKPFGTYKVW